MLNVMSFQSESSSSHMLSLLVNSPAVRWNVLVCEVLSCRTLYISTSLQALVVREPLLEGALADIRIKLHAVRSLLILKLEICVGLPFTRRG